MSLLLTVLLASAAQSAPFSDATAAWLGPVATDGWSNKVELCDVDSDGDLDALVANGAAYDTADAPERAFLWRNEGDHFVDVPLPVSEGWWRVIKCGDVDGDGDSDLFFGGTFQSSSVLLVQGSEGLQDASSRLPADPRSLGDAEFADVDGDGALDLVLADWGEGDPFFVRGRPRLWMQGADGVFVDQSEQRLPGARTGFSWDLEAVDVDDDLDLDLLVSCKVCADGGLLLENDGNGVFLDQSAFLPGVGNNYEFEPLDVDDDGDLDLFTINDGPDLSERLLRNEGGIFVDDAAALAPGLRTPDDDNAALVLDVDGDGDPDVLVASLSGDDRIFVNDGGVFSQSVVATDGPFTPGSLGVALGDLDGDGRLDLVMGQGESAFDDAVYLGSDVAADAAPPFMGVPAFDAPHRRVVVRAHDHLTPVRDGDVGVEAVFSQGTTSRRAQLRHAGEEQWQTAVEPADTSVVVCARDRGGLQTCAQRLTFADDAVSDDLRLAGGGCAGTGTAPAALGLALLVFLPSRRCCHRCSRRGDITPLRGRP